MFCLAAVFLLTGRLSAGPSKITKKDVKKALPVLEKILKKKFMVQRRVMVLPFIISGEDSQAAKIRSLAEEDIKNVFLKRMGYKFIAPPGGLSREQAAKYFSGKGLPALAQKEKVRFIITGQCYFIGKSVKIMVRVYSIKHWGYIAAESIDALIDTEVAKKINILSASLMKQLVRKMKSKLQVLDFKPYRFGLNVTSYFYGTFSGFKSIEGSSLPNVLGTDLSLAVLGGINFFMFPNFNVKLSFGVSGFDLKKFTYVVEARYFLSPFSHKPLPYFGIGFSSLSFKVKDDTQSTLINAINSQNLLSFQIGFDLATLFPSFKKEGVIFELEIAAFFGVNKGGTTSDETTISFDSPEGYQLRVAVGLLFW